MITNNKRKFLVKYANEEKIVFMKNIQCFKKSI